MGRKKLEQLMLDLRRNQLESALLDTTINEVDALIQKLRKQADGLIERLSE